MCVKVKPYPLQVEHFTGYGLSSDSEEDPEDEQGAFSGQVVDVCLGNNSIILL